MKKLSIKSKLWVLVAGLMVVLCIMTGWLLERIYAANQSIESIYSNQVVPLRQMTDVISGYLDHVVDPINKLRHQEIDAAQAAQVMQAGVQKISSNWTAFMNTTLFDEEKTVAHQADQAVRQAAPVIDQMLGLLQTAKTQEALQLHEQSVAPVVLPLITLLEKISDLQLVNARNTAEQSKASMRTMFVVMGIGVLITFALCMLAAYALIQSITGNLNHAVRIAEQVAGGDLTADIQVRTHDETGRLLTALHSMNDSLVKIVRHIRNSSESIVMGTSEIAVGNNDLSQRTEEQASNLQQTAASMEELASTVRLNSDNAAQATQLSNRASQTASQGGEAMQRVNQSMLLISESSKKITDIIGVIDSIAFQTNILALNAAVEAARAGEQGRGFAVVAAEVRSLAGRSAQAAKEIKQLISQSVQQVDIGAQQVTETTQTMESIVQQVREAATLIHEISSASKEQSQGVQQVSDAVAQLDQVTQQNAALVEESAAAADSLNQQARDLAHVVASFKLKASDTALSVGGSAHPVAAMAAAPASASVTRTTPQSPAAADTRERKASPRSTPQRITAPAHSSSAPQRTAEAADDWESF